MRKKRVSKDKELSKLKARPIIKIIKNIIYLYKVQRINKIQRNEKIGICFINCCRCTFTFKL